MKILFLDFDGVITTFEYNHGIDERRVEIVEDIVAQTGCKIVVSSDWAKDYKDHENFIKYTFTKPFIKAHKTFFDAIVGITNQRTGRPTRGDEISDYLEHIIDLETYAILDDVCDFNDNQLFHFIQTDTYDGLTTREAKMCIDLLNNKKITAPMRMNYELLYRWRRKISTNGQEDKITTYLMDYYHQKFSK